MANERNPLLGVRTLLGPGPKLMFRAGVAFATVGIVAGAFGAHGLRKKPGIDADKIHAWGTATSYSIYNGLALMLLSMHPRFSVHRFAGPAIAAGGLVFSSSIIALVLNRDRFRFLGPTTPLGGLIMISGYLSLLF